MSDGHVLSHPIYYKYICAPLSKLSGCASACFSFVAIQWNTELNGYVALFSSEALICPTSSLHYSQVFPLPNHSLGSPILRLPVTSRL